MPARPSDEELAAALSEEHDRQEQSRRNARGMNALLRGESPSSYTGGVADDTGEPGDVPADMNAAIRKAAGRPYKTQRKEQS